MSATLSTVNWIGSYPSLSENPENPPLRNSEELQVERIDKLMRVMDMKCE